MPILVLENFPATLDQARAGDGDALQKLIELYWNNLARFLGRYRLGDEAEDILQEFFIFLIQRDLLAKSNATTPIQLRNYLLSCLHWHVLSHLPKDKINRDYPLETEDGHTERWAAFAFSESTEIQVLKDLDFSLLHEAIRTLNLGYRRVIQLHLDGYTHKEIGEILDLPQNTVSSNIRRAKQELKAYLTARGVGE